MYDHLGQDQEIKPIAFLTQFGYRTRIGPTVQLHPVQTDYCSDVNETKYIQRCDGIYCIIPGTLFLVTLYNVCFTFQDGKSTNLLISALDHFGLDSTVDDDDETFMNTISKSTLDTFCQTGIKCANKQLYNYSNLSHHLIIYRVHSQCSTYHHKPSYGMD